MWYCWWISTFGKNMLLPSSDWSEKGEDVVRLHRLQKRWLLWSMLYTGKQNPVQASRNGECLDLPIYPDHNLTIFTTNWTWRQHVSVTPISTYKTTRIHNPEDCNLNNTLNKQYLKWDQNDSVISLSFITNGFVRCYTCFKARCCKDRNINQLRPCS
jgi:hypothetical protein